MNETQKKQIVLLVKEYSKNRDTSSLVSLIADSNGMLGACQEMVDQCNVQDSDIEQWLTSICQDVGTSFHTFLKEIQHIVKLFTPSWPDEEPFAILGVSVDASQEEIKHAYRKLSLAHHPDTASQSTAYNPDRFIQISRAYHALTNPDKNREQRSSKRAAPAWRKEKRRVVSVAQRKKNFLWIIGILAVLLSVSLLFAINHRKRTMLAGLQHSKGAFIPPRAKRTVLLSAPYLSERRTDIEYTSVDNRNTGGVPVNENANSPDERVEDLQAGIANASAAEEHLRKQNDSSISGTNLAQNENIETDISIVETIVTLTQDKNLKRLAAPDLQKSRQPGSTALTTESEPDGATPGETGNKLDEKPPANIRPQTQQTAAMDEVKQVQGEAGDDVVDQQGLSAVKRADTAASSDRPRDGDVTFGREEQLLQTAVVGDSTTLLPNLNAKTDTLLQPSNNLAAPQNLRQKVDEFFLGYIDAYGQRNIGTFTSYFDDGAKENGKSFEKMQSIYEELFEETSSVTLNINDRKLRKEGDNIIVEATFQVVLIYKDDRMVSGAGPITFELVADDDSYKIKMLSYEFN